MPDNTTLARSQPGDFAIEVGQYFRHGITVFQVREVRGSHLVVEHATSLERRYIELHVLAQGYLSGMIIPCNEDAAVRALSLDPFTEDDEAPVVTGAPSLMSEVAQATGQMTLKYISALKGLGYSSLRPTPLLRLDFDRLKRRFGDANPPKLSTLYRWSLRIAQCGGDVRAAYPNFASRGGRGKSRIDPSAGEELQKILDELKADPKKQIRFNRIEGELLRRLDDRYGRESAVLLLPGRSTITREAKKSIGAYGICVRNSGKKAADKRFRSWHPRDRATSPLEVVEFDDKDTRVFGIDERTGLPGGRIYITSGVDQYSTLPLGFSISDQSRDSWSAINALANCVLPKDVSLPEWTRVKGDVPFFGAMGIALFDNALYNHAAWMQAASSEISQRAVIQFAQPYTPTEKSAVEDFNGRMVSGFLVTLPGFGGHKNSKDMLKEGLLAANLTVADFKQGFFAWVYNVFSNTPREGGLSPRQRWEMGMLGRRQRLPADIHRVQIAAMLPRESKLRPEQILFCGLIYQNARLKAMQRRLGHKAHVSFRIHPENLQRICVFDPFSQEWFWVPSTNPEYTTNLTLKQHILIRKMARQAGSKNPTILELMRERAKLAKLVEQSRWSSKLRERKWAAKVSGRHTGPEAPLNQPTTQVVTDLEFQVHEIAAVELEAGDEGWDIPEFI